MSETYQFDFSGMENDNMSATENSLKRSVALCYANDDSSEFTTVTKMLEADNTEVLVYNVLDELVCGNSYTEGFGGFHSMAVPDFEFTCGTLTVDLPIDAAGGKTEEEMLVAGTAMANTFLGLDEIDAVNILIGGRSFFMSGFPVGVFTQPVDNVALLYADLENGQTYAADPDNAKDRTVLLYYPTADGKHLLPIVRNLSIDTESMPNDILNALGKTEGIDGRLACGIGSIRTLLTAEPQINVSDVGERYIEIDLQSILPDYLALSGIGAFGFFGSITMSLTSFIPNIAYIRCTVGGEPLDKLAMPDGSELTIADGCLYRENFVGFIGGTAVIYMIDSANRLVTVRTVAGLHEHATVYGVLRTLFETGDMDGMRSAVPEGIDGADIKSIECGDSIAVVDLSADFYTKCQNLDESGERLLIYAMINTLCELNGIDAVKITVEGMKIETFVHNICLSDPLMPDPGLIDGE